MATCSSSCRTEHVGEAYSVNSNEKLPFDGITYLGRFGGGSIATADMTYITYQIIVDHNTVQTCPLTRSSQMGNDGLCWVSPGQLRGPLRWILTVAASVKGREGLCQN